MPRCLRRGSDASPCWTWGSSRGRADPPPQRTRRSGTHPRAARTRLVGLQVKRIRCSCVPGGAGDPKTCRVVLPKRHSAEVNASPTRTLFSQAHASAIPCAPAPKEPPEGGPASDPRVHAGAFGPRPLHRKPSALSLCRGLASAGSSGPCCHLPWGDGRGRTRAIRESGRGPHNGARPFEAPKQATGASRTGNGTPRPVDGTRDGRRPLGSISGHGRTNLSSWRL
jgi:hypothetical protein